MTGLDRQGFWDACYLGALAGGFAESRNIEALADGLAEEYVSRFHSGFNSPDELAMWQHIVITLARVERKLEPRGTVFSVDFCCEWADTALLHRRRYARHHIERMEPR